MDRQALRIGGPGRVHDLGLYWPGARNECQLAQAEPANQALCPARAAEPTLHAAIERLRDDLVALYRAHGAVHFQLGKFYPYADAIDDAGLRLARALKDALDPGARMNPGALGF